jgi:hypothetical protein
MVAADMGVRRVTDLGVASLYAPELMESGRDPVDPVRARKERP